MNDATKAEFETDGDLRLHDGNLVVASGHGIDFSAQTASSATGASASAELLDHYEEGTWTPVCDNITFSSLSGNYTRIGRMVWLNFSATGATAGSGSGTVAFTGIPFQAQKSARFMPSFYKVDFSASYSDLCEGICSGSQIYFLRQNSTTSGGSGNYVQQDQVGGSAQIAGSCVYCTDA